MKKQIGKIAVSAIALLFITLCGCVKDPYEGMVSVPDGTGGQMWVELYKDLPVSGFTSEGFSNEGQFVVYDSESYRAMRGVDVSEHQKGIDWNAVREENVEFAIIRAGYRGYSEGEIYTDEYFQQNVEGALKAGLDVGVYFFSQATDESEAVEEAEYLLELIEDYEISLPVFFDWEPMYEEGSRTAETDRATLTDCCLAFCKTVKEAGYESGVYFYRSLGYNHYELDKLSGLTFWAAAPGDYPDFYYAHRFWQYSYTARISGIEADVDLDILFVPKDSKDRE